MTTGSSRTAVAQRLLEALEGRDYEALAACLAPDATMQAVVPAGVRDDTGAAAIVQRFERWTAGLDDYAIDDADATEFADVVRLRWTVRGEDPSVGFTPSTFEQAAYAEIEDGRITRLRLACSGHRRLE